MTHSLSFLLFLGIAMGYLFRFSFFSPDVKFSLLDITILILNISYLIPYKGQNNLKRTLSSPLLLSLLLFFAVALLSLVVSGSSYGLTAQIVGGLYLLRWLNYSLAFISVQRLFSHHQLENLLLLGGFTVAVGGLFQYFFFPDLRPLQSAHWDPHYYRVVGAFLDPGFTGLILVFTLLLLLNSGNFSFLSINLYSKIRQVLANKSKKISFLRRLVLLIKRLRPFWARFAISCLVYAALALTYSRSSYLAFVIGLGHLSWKKRSPRMFLVGFLLFIVTLVILPRPGGEGVRLERTRSIYARLLNWRQTASAFATHPLLGVGFNTYRYFQKDKGLLSSDDWQENHAGAGADSSLLFVAATTGIIGLIAYLHYLKHLLSRPVVRLVFLPLLFHSLFLNSLFYPPIMLWLSLAAAQEAA